MQIFIKFFRRSADAKVIKVYIDPGPCFQLIFSLNYSIELNLLDLYCHKQSDKNQMNGNWVSSNILCILFLEGIAQRMITTRFPFCFSMMAFLIRYVNDVTGATCFFFSFREILSIFLSLVIMAHRFYYRKFRGLLGKMKGR